MKDAHTRESVSDVHNNRWGGGCSQENFAASINAASNALHSTAYNLSTILCIQIKKGLRAAYFNPQSYAGDGQASYALLRKKPIKIDPYV